MESRLPSVIPYCDVAIPDFATFRKDPTHASTTGLHINIHESLTYKRLKCLEDDSSEAVLLEIN